jgi:Bacterial membrane protein YfhO
LIQPDLHISNEKYRHPVFYLFFLLIVVLVAYWPISFHVFSLKNDALNYFLPVRHLVSESYSNNILPLWTPYLNLGYPLHADMQSGVWNPFVQLFSFFGPYTLYTLQLETILYIFLGGAGIFFLLKHFRLHPFANIFASVAYMLCGFNSDSCQFLNWIAGTAFLPFVFLFYYRCLEERSVKQGIYTGIALFFLFSCAYPADFIIIAYLMVSMLIVHIVSGYRKKETLITKNLLPAHLAIAIVFILLSGPAILSYAEGLPLQERGSGATYEAVMSNPLHPALLSSFTTPLAIWKMPGVSVTDPLERNSYIGIAGFMLLLISFLVKSTNSTVRFSKWAALIFLLFSFGETGGIRIISYYILPLMNSFRHPANAKMFTLFFCCILAGFKFNDILNNTVPLNILKKGWWATLSVMLIVLLISFFTPFSLFRFSSLSSFFRLQQGVSFINHLKIQLDNISFADLVLLSTIVQVIFLLLIYRFLFKKINIKFFLATAIINCILFTIFFQPFTVINKSRASHVQAMVNKFSVTGYPLPDNTQSLEQNSLDNEKYMAEIGCINLYNKKAGRSDYRISPSNQLLQNKFWFNEAFRNKILKYPLLYKPEFVFDINRWNYDEVQDSSTYKWAFREPLKHVHEFSNDDSTNIVFTKFEPNRIEGKITTNEEGEFVLTQTNYPRWKLYIDDKASPIHLTNIAFMGFSVPKGTHTFSFRYEAMHIRVAFIISLSVLGLLFAAITYGWIKNKNSPTP